MKQFLVRHRETLLVFCLGLFIFGALNLLMLQMNPDVWTSMKQGPYTAFHKGWELSGFDNTTYIVVSTWRPFYIMMRHPLIMYFVWPMYELNDILEDSLSINCAIYIVAIFWTFISTIAWTLLYRIMRKIIMLSVPQSLLLCLFFFSFSHVMIATFAPDHMILSLTLLLLTLYLGAKATNKGKQLSTWKSLLLCFLSTGITTTNCVKIWLIDTMTMQGRLSEKRWWKHFICHGLLYLIPLALVGSIYWLQCKTTFQREKDREEQLAQKLKVDNPAKYAQITSAANERNAKNEAKQMGDNKLFQWTDFSLPLAPSVVENFFGEGFILHESYTLRDCHREGHRPDIVKYNNWFDYCVEGMIVFLLLIGIWSGRKERLMWMALSVFGFDCLLHLGFRFALNDIYIMTAHWAFVIPIAIGYALKKANHYKIHRSALIGVVALLTIWLWYHNLSLTYEYIMNAN